MKINNAIEYLAQQCREEHEREAQELSKQDRSLMLLPDGYLKEEEKFYRNPKHTHALLAAIAAVGKKK